MAQHATDLVGRVAAWFPKGRPLDDVTWDSRHRSVVRLLWAVLTIIPGAIVLGIVAYLVAWFIMPNAPASHAVVTPSVA